MIISIVGTIGIAVTLFDLLFLVDKRTGTVTGID